MPISDFGALNTAALVVPNIYVQIMPPTLFLLNGVPTNKVGIVGVGSWGPVGVPRPMSSYADAVREFGPLAARAFDMPTAVAIASLQGAQNMAGVRVTDGTELAATGTVQTTGLTVTGKWSGSFGNNIGIQITAGSRASSYKVAISQAGSGRVPEIFDNVAAGLAANAIWVAIAAAINAGMPGQRSASDLIVATAGALATAPTLMASPQLLTGGTDGNSGVNAAALVGVDTVPRKGMYALRKSGVSVAMLADVTDATTWPTQLAFGLQEGIYMLAQGAAGQDAAAAATAKTTAGIDHRDMKVILGDWPTWADPVLGINRMVSPQAFFLGYYGNSSPHLSALNKPVYGVVATQRSLSGAPYSESELQILALAGIDVITNPIPRGDVFGFRFGRNSSSDASAHGDNHTRMTNFLAQTLDRGMGRFVGEPTSDDSLARTEATIGAFLATLKGVPGSPETQMIEDFSVLCRGGPGGNNPPNRRALGYRQADVKVRYLSITEYFLVNLEGGQSVTITRAPAPAA